MMIWIITISLNIRSMFKNSNGEEVRASDYAHFPPMMTKTRHTLSVLKRGSGTVLDVAKKVTPTLLQKSKKSPTQTNT